MLYRENSPTHPSGSAYYQTLILPTGSSQTFNEDTDRWSEVGGGFPYRIYGTPVGMGQMYGIEIEGGPEVGDHDLDDCVLFGLYWPRQECLAQDRGIRLRVTELHCLCRP